MSTGRYFKKNGAVVYVAQDEGEPEEQFSERGEFVVSQAPSNDNDYETAIRLSRIYRNHKYNRSEYSSTIMKQMELMRDRMFEE
jgi:hypothetical protein